MKNHELIINGEFQNVMERELLKDVDGLANDFIEYVLATCCEHDNIAPFTWDDVENMFVDNSDEIEAIETKFELIADFLEIDEQKWIDSELSEKEERRYENALNKQTKLNQEREELEGEQETPQEVMQWFKVSPYLFRQLQANNDVVLETPDGYYYGRCGFGQALYMDYNIIEIYKEHTAVKEVIEKIQK